MTVNYSNCFFQKRSLLYFQYFPMCTTWGRRSQTRKNLKPRLTSSCFMSQSDASVTVFPDHSLKWNKFYLTYGWKSSSSSSELQFLYGKEEPFEIATAPNLWIRSSVDNSALLVSVRPGFESWRSLNFFLRLLSSNCLTCCSPKRTTAIVDLIVDLIITGATKYVWLLRGTEIKGNYRKRGSSL